MISVLLTLLKIIGIALLVLLGLIIVILLTVLFVPVRYRIKGYYKEEFVFHLKATWLLHLVTVSVNFEKELVTSFKILGIDISSLFNKKDDTSSNLSKEKNDTGKTQDKETNFASDNQTDITNDSSVATNVGGQTLLQDEPENNSDFTSSQSLFSKIHDFIIGIRDKILFVYTKIKEIKINIKNKKDSVERYIRILQREEVKGAFSLCKKRIIKMVKHILPRHMKIHLHLGMEDPSVTGYILGLYSVLSDKLRRQILLQADFENVILEADYTIKGHCHAIRFLHEIVCIVTDKNCRSFYKLVKKEILNERK